MSRTLSSMERFAFFRSSLSLCMLSRRYSVVHQLSLTLRLNTICLSTSADQSRNTNRHHLLLLVSRAPPHLVLRLKYQSRTDTPVLRAHMPWSTHQSTVPPRTHRDERKNSEQCRRHKCVERDVRRCRGREKEPGRRVNVHFDCPSSRGLQEVG